MNAMIALQELRKTRKTRHKHSALCDTIKEQLEQIVALKRERDTLEDRLAALQAGQTVEELHQWEDPELTQANKVLIDLKEKLLAYRLIGPCGMTVSDVESPFLEVTFSPMWQSVTESFFLSLVAKDGFMEVSSTNIPYFFDVPSLVASMKTDVVALLDKINLKLVAYIHRKGEVMQVLKTHSDVISESSFTEPVTSVDLKLEAVDSSTEIHKHLSVYVTYASVDDVHPVKAKFSTENMTITEDVEEELRGMVRTHPLSSAMTRIVEYLVSAEALVEPQQLEEDQRDSDVD